MPALAWEAVLPLTLTFRRGRWSASGLMTLLTLIAVLGFTRLGIWQWHRAEAKRAIAAAFTAGSGSIHDLDAGSTAELPRFALVRVHGQYDGAHQFLLENLSHDGQPGYEVLTPLQLEGGRTLMVNRGWLPLTASRQRPPDVSLAPMSGDMLVSGRLDALPVPGIALGRLPPQPGAPWPKLTSFPTIADLSAAIGRPLEPQQLLLAPDAPLGYVRDWHPTGIGPERHIAYAVQWWGFAVVALVLYARLNWQRA
jgi:surfeit locus 1 family protein